MAGSNRTRAAAGKVPSIGAGHLASALEQAPPARAKLVTSGRGQAVRLPKGFRLPGAEVMVRREGVCLVLEPVGARGWPLNLWKRLDELAEGLDDGWERPADTVPRPIEEERELP